MIVGLVRSSKKRDWKRIEFYWLIFWAGWVEYPLHNSTRFWMLQPTARLLPGVIASAMLLTGTVTAEAAAHARQNPAWRGWRESGQASWYGSWHQGRPTSSGEPFDQNAMTAAHANLPLGSRVRVTMRETGQSVVVTINDRQPPKRERIIDLSRGAAARLGMVDQGVGQVELAAVDSSTPEEVAEAPDDLGRAVNPRRHDRQHMHHARP